MSAAVIRSYTAGDRLVVRQICCETADRGDPVERIFPDRELVADLVTRYYTDYEPRTSWVSEEAGGVIGYLTGCLDSRRYQRIMSWRIVPQAVLGALGRGVLVRPATWRVLNDALGTWQRGGLDRRIPLDRYPAHFHINLVRQARGQRVGKALVERFIERVHQQHLPGVHVSVRDDNAAACRFFERLGFTSISRHPVMLPEGERDALHHTVIYAKAL